MESEEYQKMLCDGVIVSAGYTGAENVILYTASQGDAEWLYSTVEDVAETRNLDETAEKGHHREYYLDDEDDRVVRPVYTVSFIPTDFAHQRMLHWADENQNMVAPTDFEMTPTIAEMIYRAGAHEMRGENVPYIEFDAVGSQKLQAELQNLDIQTTNVGELWRMDEENSARYRAYAGIEAPERR